MILVKLGFDSSCALLSQLREVNPGGGKPDAGACGAPSLSADHETSQNNLEGPVRKGQIMKGQWLAAVGMAANGIAPGGTTGISEDEVLALFRARVQFSC